MFVVFRIKKAGNTFGALRKCLFSNPNISVDAKRAAYEGLILSILLYGAESWRLTKKFRVTVTECYNIRISNEELLRRLKLRKIDYYITKRRLPWAGDVARIDFDRLPRKMLSSWVCTKRPSGAPEFTYGHGLY